VDVRKMAGSEDRTREPDATENAGCYTCERPECSCGNNDEYIKKLVDCITKEVMDKLGN
jgi:hypothetical protein